MHQKDNGGNIETAGSSHTHYIFLMKTGEFTEPREAVQDLLVVEKLLILHIFHRVSSTHKQDCEHFHTPRQETFCKALASLLSQEKRYN